MIGTDIRILMAEQDKTDLQSVERLLKEGRKQEALPLLAGYLQQNPNSAQGWWLLGLTVSDPKQQIECVERVLQIDPTSVLAQVRLEKLREEVSTPSPIPPMVEPISFDESAVILPQPLQQESEPINEQITSPIVKPKSRMLQYIVISILACILLAVLVFAVVMFFQSATNQSAQFILYGKILLFIL